MAPTLRTRAPKAPAATTPAATDKKVTAAAQAAKKMATKAKAAPNAAKATPAPAAKAAAKSTTATKAAATDPKSATSAKKAVTKTTKAKPVNKPASGTAPKAKPAAKKPATKQSTKAVKATQSVVLDHRAYPHIFDAIVESAPYGSLLRLRGTCKDMHKRTDPLLAHHIVLRAGLPPPKGAKWERTGLPRGPEKARARTYRVNAAAVGGQLPGWVCDFNHVNNNAVDSCGEDCDRYRSYWTELFTNETKIVDWQPWGDQGYLMERPAKIFTNLEVIRCYPFETQRCMFQAPKFVVFVDFEKIDPTRYNGAGYTPSVYVEDKTTKHHVASVEYDTAMPTLPSCWVTFPSLGNTFLETLTIIFLPAEGSADEVNPAWDNALPRPHGLLWDAVNWLRVRTKTKMTFVGATEMPPHLIGIRDGVERTREEVEELAFQNMFEWIRNDPQEVTEEREETIRNQVTWYTRDEYRELVGPEQWKIETERTYNWDK